MDLDRQLAITTRSINYFGLSGESKERETYGQGELLPGDLTNCLLPHSHSYYTLIAESLVHPPPGKKKEG